MIQSDLLLFRVAEEFLMQNLYNILDYLYGILYNNV